MTKHYTRAFRRNHEQKSLSYQTTEALSMFPYEMDYLVRQEQRKDQLRRLEQINLIKSIKPVSPSLYCKLIVELGIKFVQWGQTLQRYGAEQPKIKPA